MREFKREIKDIVKTIPIETKQKLLDLLHEGKSIGEARDLTGLDKYDLTITCEIINQNLYKCVLLNNKAV